MGIDYNVYVGPYIEIETKKQPTKQKEYEYKACLNNKCKLFREAQRTKNHGYGEPPAKFCSQCGGEIKTIKETLDEEYDVYELCEEFGILDQVSPDYSDSENGDTQLFFPRIEDRKGGSLNIKYDEVWEDLSDLDVAVEIEKVKQECSKALEVLEKAYGVKPKIKWGVISSAS